MPGISFSQGSGSAGRLILKSDTSDTDVRTSVIRCSLATASSMLSGEDLWAQVQEALRDDASGTFPCHRALLILAPASLSMAPIIRQVQALLASGVAGDQGAISLPGLVDVFDQADSADLLAKTVSPLYPGTYICRMLLGSPHLRTVEMAVLHEPAWRQDATLLPGRKTDPTIVICPYLYDAFERYITAAEGREDPGDLVLLTVHSFLGEMDVAETMPAQPQPSETSVGQGAQIMGRSGGGLSVSKLVDSWNQRSGGHD